MSGPETPTATVEQVLCCVDRQTEAVLRHGALAVESDLRPTERVGSLALLRGLPLGIWSALITQVSRRGRRTVVRTRFMTTSGSFILVTVWELGPHDRPWVVHLAAQDRLIGHAAPRRELTHAGFGSVRP
jgi:hypothetical protein